ncbi:Phosphatidylinositol 3-and 4-kinase family protein [Ectocarpus siliculosus]|uniref:Phosphatidylinositol 3-and 4-kinase family protein n=1 Tax=Ectocarpus siliculosus TaxID=2880 RepID=D7FS67_ECTSI|nr:Phosphatidylinositol 3-and 4-kinase family protein [Ectocarpus siliculosus]|eukprot:CBJ31008.1 Phosphatidylinositol 3-and 4-kinase family protein [Ectocarpus siliculosus]
MSSFGRFGNGEDHAMREFSICIKPLDGKIHARKRVLTVKSWSTVKDLKDVLQSLLHLPAASQRIFFRGGELRNPHTLQDCGIYKDGQTVYLASSPQDEMGKPYSLEPFLGAGELPRSLSRVLGQVKRGLDRGFKPELTLEGTGGTYFLQDAARQKVAVFKPQDEEPFAPNNPREAMQGGLGGGTVSMRPGIGAGESYVREVAAYILDDRNLHGVPPTTLVEAKHPAFCYWDHKERKKLGSFQEFVRHDMVVEDISPSRLTRREVQKIALLDMRILNRDRNSVNILVRSRPRRSCSFSERIRGGGGGDGSHSRYGSSDSNTEASPRGVSVAGASRGGTQSGGLATGVGGGGEGGGRRAGSRRPSGGVLAGSTEYELIPIDHGLCLSNELVIDWCDWCWLDWRQIKEPVDPELYDYIMSFEPEATAERLGNTLNLQEPCLRNLRIAETLLQEGVKAGLTLYDIACIIRREDFDKASELETLIARATVGSTDWASKEDKDNWFLSAGGPEGVPATAPSLATESSTDASSEEYLTSAPELRGAGKSVDGGGGRAGGARGEGLRIWAPGARTLSRDMSAGGGGDGDSTSPAKSAESDAEPISPAGFWREKFETIDARNATRRFSHWEDGTLGDEASPGESVAGSGGASSRGERAGGGRPPLRKDGGDPVAASLEDESADPGEPVGTDAKVGRKLFSSSEKPPPPPPPRRKTPPLAAERCKKNMLMSSAGNSLEPMVEVDQEVPSPAGPTGGAGSEPPPPLWATTAAVERTREAVAGVGSSGSVPPAEEKNGNMAGPGLGWRRGEAGLVIPEPMPQQKPRPVMQSVVPHRVSRVGGDGGGGGGGGDPKRPLAAPRPATASPTLPPAGGEHKSKSPQELQQALTPGVKIVRSYSYHGLGSMALYDAAKRGSARYSIRRRPSENSKQFKLCFFRFFDFLVCDLVKRRHRTMVKERAARQAAEQQQSSSSLNRSSTGGGGAANSTMRGRGASFERLKTQHTPPPPPPPPPARGGSNSGSPHAGMPAAVKG